MRSLEQMTREIAEIMSRPVAGDGSRSRAVPMLNGLTYEQLEDLGLSWDGKSPWVHATCRSCENTYELEGELATADWDRDMSYCGGSERCLP